MAWSFVPKRGSMDAILFKEEVYKQCSDYSARRLCRGFEFGDKPIRDCSLWVILKRRSI